MFFDLSSSPDPDNARRNIANLDQGGLGLPEKDFYFRSDASSEEIRQKYVAHIGKMLQLSASARLLTPSFVGENFDFYSRTLTGASQLRPRWKRCVSAVDDELGEALGRRDMTKIGQLVDRNEWETTPPTVNAYYSPTENNINFSAGILGPPFYSNDARDAVNYGAVGSVIGHELTHGFDDEGRQFDADGNLKDWWLKSDRDRFVKLVDCFVNGGIRLAYLALLDDLAAQSILQVETDPHAAPEFRVDGTVSNMPEFSQAFSCKASDKMFAVKACRVW